MRTNSSRFGEGEVVRWLRHAVSFLARYGYAAGAVLHLFTFGLRSARHRQQISTLARQLGYADDRSAPGIALPIVDLEELVPDYQPVQLRALEEVDGNISLYELIAISKLVKHFRPLRIFEIGTFDGRTTLNLAANAPEAHVFTLDLPREAVRNTRLVVDRGDEVYIDKDESGTRFRGTDCESRITQLFGDSAAWDFSSFVGMNFVFVDGSHAYEYVLSDSRNALWMTAERGIVLWHDYGVWDGVTRALNELRQQEESFAMLTRIAGTSLVVLRVPPEGCYNALQHGTC